MQTYRVKLIVLLFAALGLSQTVSDPITANTGVTYHNAGCYGHVKTAYDLKDGFYYDPSLTLEKCINLCAKDNYQYAAAEFGSQCFCGKAVVGVLGQDVWAAPQSSCNEPCAGNAAANVNEFCGADGFQQLYCIDCPSYSNGTRYPVDATSSTTTSATLTPSTSSNTASAPPTPPASAPPTPSAPDSSAKSSKTIPATTTAPAFLNATSPIYTTSGTALPTTSLSTNPEHIIANRQIKYDLVGCYTDNPNDDGADRTLGTYIDTTRSDTTYTRYSNEDCAAQCAAGGYIYSGTEYYYQCLCGNDILHGAALVDPSNCDTPCRDVPEESCGGTSHLTLYQNFAAFYNDGPDDSGTDTGDTSDAGDNGNADNGDGNNDNNGGDNGNPDDGGNNDDNGGDNGNPDDSGNNDDNGGDNGNPDDGANSNGDNGGDNSDADNANGSDNGDNGNPSNDSQPGTSDNGGINTLGLPTSLSTIPNDATPATPIPLPTTTSAASVPGLSLPPTSSNLASDGQGPVTAESAPVSPGGIPGYPVTKPTSAASPSTSITSSAASTATTSATTPATSASTATTSATTSPNIVASTPSSSLTTLGTTPTSASLSSSATTTSSASVPSASSTVTFASSYSTPATTSKLTLSTPKVTLSSLGTPGTSNASQTQTTSPVGYSTFSFASSPSITVPTPPYAGGNGSFPSNGTNVPPVSTLTSPPSPASSSNSTSESASSPVLYQGIGCYTFDGCQPPLVAHPIIQGNTLEQCAAAANGTKYFGVALGTQCYAGDDLLVKATNETNCKGDGSYPCPGNSAQTCGGYQGIAIYKALSPGGSNSGSGGDGNGSSSETGTGPIITAPGYGGGSAATTAAPYKPPRELVCTTYWAFQAPSFGRM